MSEELRWRVLESRKRLLDEGCDVLVISGLRSLFEWTWHDPVLHVQTHELDPLIGLRISRRRACHEHHTFGGNTIFLQPVRGPFAPVVGFLGKIDGIHAVGECETLTCCT